MVSLETLYPDIKGIMGDSLGLIWPEAKYMEALKKAQIEYLRRTKAYRFLTEVEIVNDDKELKYPQDTERLDFSHNDKFVKLSQIDYYSALRLYGGLLETEDDTPYVLYHSKADKATFRTYPNCEGILDIFDWNQDYGVAQEIEGFDIIGDWGVTGDGLGVIDIFQNFDGDKVTVNVSLKPSTDFILVRFPDALIWRAGAELMQERKETENLKRSAIFQGIFNKYVIDDIRLLKRRTGIKAHGGLI